MANGWPLAAVAGKRADYFLLRYNFLRELIVSIFMKKLEIEANGA